MGRNAGIIGKNSAAAGEALLGMSNLADKFLNRIGTSAGLGYLYALDYVSNTGGTLTIYSGDSDLSSTLDSYFGNTNGDALFLPNGNYTVDSSYSSNFVHDYSSSIFPSGFYGVFGGHPNEVQILANANPVSRSENSIVSWDDAGTISFTAGYMTIRTIEYGTTTYTIPLFHGTGTTDLDYVLLKNVVISRDGGDATYLYDNNADTGYIKLLNCTVGNIGSFGSNYSGSLTNKSADNCLFGNSSVLSYVGTTTNCTDGATITVDNTTKYLSYDTGTYTDRGHLYGLSDTTWAEPA